MRRSVVVIAGSLFGVAMAILVAARQPSADAPTPASVGTMARPIPAPSSRSSESRAQDRPAAANAVSRLAIDRYLSDDRLFDTFGQLRQSARGGDLWTAHRIAFDCRTTLRDASLVGAVLAGRSFNHFEKTGPGTRAGAESGEAGSLTVTQAVATPEQVAAARELRRRCDGFQSMTLATYRAALADIDARLQHVDDPAGLASAIVARHAPATPDRLRTILASRDPIALTLLDETLGERWQRYTGKPISQAMFGAPTPAMQLVACDLEVDCSPTSRTALLGCIDDAAGCGLDVHHQLMRLETPPIQQSIEDTHVAYLHAIVSGDYAIWGL